MDVAAQLAREKNFEASLKIGANRNTVPMKSARFAANGRSGTNELSNTQGEKELKETKLGETMTTNKTVDLKETL